MLGNQSTGGFWPYAPDARNTGRLNPDQTEQVRQLGRRHPKTLPHKCLVQLAGGEMIVHLDTGAQHLTEARVGGEDHYLAATTSHLGRNGGEQIIGLAARVDQTIHPGGFDGRDDPRERLPQRLRHGWSLALVAGKNLMSPARTVTIEHPHDMGG